MENKYETLSGPEKQEIYISNYSYHSSWQNDRGLIEAEELDGTALYLLSEMVKNGTLKEFNDFSTLKEMSPNISEIITTNPLFLVSWFYNEDIKIDFKDLGNLGMSFTFENLSEFKSEMKGYSKSFEFDSEFLIKVIAVLGIPGKFEKYSGYGQKSFWKKVVNGNADNDRMNEAKELILKTISNSKTSPQKKESSKASIEIHHPVEPGYESNQEGGFNHNSFSENFSAREIVNGANRSKTDNAKAESNYASGLADIISDKNISKRVTDFYWTKDVKVKEGAIFEIQKSLYSLITDYKKSKFDALDFAMIKKKIDTFIISKTSNVDKEIKDYYESLSTKEKYHELEELI